MLWFAVAIVLAADLIAAGDGSPPPDEVKVLRNTVGGHECERNETARPVDWTGTWSGLPLDMTARDCGTTAAQASAPSSYSWTARRGQKSFHHLHLTNSTSQICYGRPTGSDLRSKTDDDSYVSHDGALPLAEHVQAQHNLSIATLAVALVAVIVSVCRPADRCQQPTRPGAANGVDVRTFGAVGDGKADDTAAFARAIASVAAQRGGTVLVPGGIFMLDQLALSRVSSVTLRGVGAASTLKLRSAPKQNIQGVTTWLLLSGCEGCAVTSVHMDLNGIEATAIGVQASTSVSIRDCTIHNSPGTIGNPRPALVLHSSSGAVIEANTVYDVSTWFYFGMSTHEGQILDCVMSANIFRNAKATSAANCSRSQIIGNTFDTSMYCGIELGGLGRPMTDWTIAGNTFNACKEPALQVSALQPGGQTGYGSISNNTFSNGTSVDSCGVYCFGDVCDVVIANNVIRDCTKGIVLTVGTVGGCKRFSIVGNHICDTRTATGPCRMSVGIELGTYTSGGGKVVGEALADVNVDGNTIDNSVDCGISLQGTSGEASIARCRISANRMTRCANTGVSVGTHPAPWAAMTIVANQCDAPIRLSIPQNEVSQWEIDANRNSRAPNTAVYAIAGSGGVPRFSGLQCTGSPEGVLVGAVGSTCINIAGGKMSTAWVKQVGSDNTGWVAVA